MLSPALAAKLKTAKDAGVNEEATLRNKIKNEKAKTDRYKAASVAAAKRAGAEYIKQIKRKNCWKKKFQSTKCKGYLVDPAMSKTHGYSSAEISLAFTGKTEDKSAWNKDHYVSKGYQWFRIQCSHSAERC